MCQGYSRPKCLHGIVNVNTLVTCETCIQLCRYRHSSHVWNLYSPVQLLSRVTSGLTSRSTSGSRGRKEVAVDKTTNLGFEDYLNNRDFIGAMTLITIGAPGVTQDEVDKQLWMAYCAYHLADYKKAAEIYHKLITITPCKPEVFTFLACCEYMLGFYAEGMEHAKQGPKTGLQNRLMLHLAHKIGDAQTRYQCMTQLTLETDDQLSLAALKVLEGDIMSAINIYETQLFQTREYAALYVYIAWCYHKRGYFDTSDEMLSKYLNLFPDSILALNLRACNVWHTLNRQVAEAEMKSIDDMMSPSNDFGKELIKHNLVVFQNGKRALEVLPFLVDVVTEACFNLTVSHLHHGNAVDAFNVLNGPNNEPYQVYALKAIAYAMLGQQGGSEDDNAKAVSFFNLVGHSPKHEETVLGRQCMASSFFLKGEFPKVVRCLDTIKSYFINNDEFNYNYGQAQTVIGDYGGAIEAFERVNSEEYRSELCYNCHLAKCYIRTNNPQAAYDLYLKMLKPVSAMMLVNLIAAECFQIGYYYYAAKAYHSLELLLPSVHVSEGKVASCIGVFEKIVTKQETAEKLPDVILMLQASSYIQTDRVLNVINSWKMDTYTGTTSGFNADV